MKAMRISCILLLAMLLLSLLSGFGISRQCRLWQNQLQQTDELIARGGRAEAEKKLSALYRNWQDAQPYFNMVVHRDTLSAAEACFQRAKVLIPAGDTAVARAALAELSAQIQSLSDAQQPLPRNIF